MFSKGSLAACWLAVASFLIPMVSMANSNQYPLHVDIRDLAEFRATELPDMPRLVSALQACHACFLPKGVSFPQSGPAKARFTRQNIAYGVELAAQPEDLRGQRRTYFLNVLVHSQTEGLFLRRAEITVQLPDFELVKVQGEDEPLDQGGTDLRIEVGLLQRKMVVEDRKLGIRKIYPLGVGGFSLDRAEIVTPEMSGVKIVNSDQHTLESRMDPVYYQGYPFIRILSQRGEYFGYGFHATMHPARGLSRGFISTGCLRMRIRDVYELYALTRFTRQRSIPVNIRMRIDLQEDHPYPFDDSRYARVEDGSRGEDGLTKMTVINEPPPLQQLAH